MPIINIAREKVLAPQGVIIPNVISNFMAVGHFVFGNDLVDCVYPIARFTGIPDATLLSETKFVNALDFNETSALEMTGEVVFDVYASGELNCVQLSSLVELMDGITFYTSDTLMPVTIIPLDAPLKVNKGDKVTISYRYTHRSALENSIFHATLLNE